MAYDILIIDDEIDICTVIADVLEDEGYKARYAHDGDSALKAINKCSPNLIILDIWLGNQNFDGLKLLKIIHKTHSNVPIIMMSGHGTVETAVKSIKIGAYDFIEKPFKSDRLLLIIKRAIESVRLLRENLELKTKVDINTNLIGVSNDINNIRQTISKIAPTNSRILITGNQGTGKELVARQIHKQSLNNEGAFIVVNCASFNSKTLEEKLFGTENQDENELIVGVLEQANLGTLLLNEITEMPLQTQSKLSRVLHEQKFFRIGGTNKVEVNVRVITSSSNDLLSAVRNKKFREDLYYRLNVVHLKIPSLKDRSEDIPLLASYYINYFMRTENEEEVKLDNKAIMYLQSYNWPGNIRQLRNVMEWIKIINGSNERVITHKMLPPEIRNNPLENDTLPFEKTNLFNLPLRKARDEFEKKYLSSQVNRFSGNISQTAQFIGMERSALHRKLRSLEVIKKVNDK